MRHGWVVGAGGGDHDAGCGGKERSEEVEEECVREVVDCECFFVAFWIEGKGAEELSAGVEEEGGDWGVGVFGPCFCKDADKGGGGEIEREKGYVGLLEESVDLLG